MLDSRKYEFIPFVIEANGAFGATALVFAKRLEKIRRSRSRGNGRYKRAKNKSQFLTTLSFEVARCNAEAILNRMPLDWSSALKVLIKDDIQIEGEAQALRDELKKMYGKPVKVLEFISGIKGVTDYPAVTVTEEDDDAAKEDDDTNPDDTKTDDKQDKPEWMDHDDDETMTHKQNQPKLKSKPTEPKLNTKSPQPHNPTPLNRPQPTTKNKIPHNIPAPNNSRGSALNLTEAPTPSEQRARHDTTPKNSNSNPNQGSAVGFSKPPAAADPHHDPTPAINQHLHDPPPDKTLTTDTPDPPEPPTSPNITLNLPTPTSGNLSVTDTQPTHSVRSPTTESCPTTQTHNTTLTQAFEENKIAAKKTVTATQPTLNVRATTVPSCKRPTSPDNSQTPQVQHDTTLNQPLATNPTQPEESKTAAREIVTATQPNLTVRAPTAFICKRQTNSNGSQTPEVQQDTTSNQTPANNLTQPETVGTWRKLWRDTTAKVDAATDKIKFNF